MGATGGLVVRRRGSLPRHGQERVERACRSLLRRAGVSVPRREHGHRDVPAALAALGITDREADVLALLADGLTSREIGSRLFISARTVDKHVERLLAKRVDRVGAELHERSYYVVRGARIRTDCPIDGSDSHRVGAVHGARRSDKTSRRTR